MSHVLIEDYLSLILNWVWIKGFPLHKPDVSDLMVLNFFKFMKDFFAHENSRIFHMKVKFYI